MNHIYSRALALSLAVALTDCSAPPTPRGDASVTVAFDADAAAEADAARVATDVTDVTDDQPRMDAVACPEGQLRCGGRCIDPAVDPNHCGACDARCPEGHQCVTGACALVCSAGQRDCGGACRDLSVDRAHCGACGAACASGQACVRGACVRSCAAGETDCGGACRDLSSDRAHCGACGAACASGQACSLGACVASCGAGQRDCAGACVDTATTPAHCGACGNACPTPPNARAACVASSCAFVCDAGFSDCNGVATDGCERDVRSDRENCGACGNRCSGGQICASGACMRAANCQTVAGVRWCYNPNACGQACNDVCASLGLPFTISDADWFAAQDSAPECQAISNAFGVTAPVLMGHYDFACAEDNLNGAHTTPATLIGPLQCSTNPTCPSLHRTLSDVAGLPCGAPPNVLGLCPCQ